MCPQFSRGWRRSLDDILIKVSIWGQQPPPTCFATLCSHFLLQKVYLKDHSLYWGWTIHNIIVKFWGQNWYSDKKTSNVSFPWMIIGKMCLESEYGKICPNQGATLTSPQVDRPTRTLKYLLNICSTDQYKRHSRASANLPPALYKRQLESVNIYWQN